MLSFQLWIIIGNLANHRTTLASLEATLYRKTIFALLLKDPVTRKLLSSLDHRPNTRGEEKHGEAIASLKAKKDTLHHTY